MSTFPKFAIQLMHTPLLVLHKDGQVVSHTLERKDAALLAMLATEGPWPPARAAGRLWSDSSEAQARANLRQRLYRLRRLAGGDVVLADPSLRLAPAVTVDLRQFAQALADDPGAGTGDLLGGLDYSDTDDLAAWVTSARERWRRQRAEVLAARASQLEHDQQIAAALVLAQRLVADDPLQAACPAPPDAPALPAGRPRCRVGHLPQVPRHAAG